MAWVGGLVAVGAAGGVAAGYLGLVTGALPLDLGVGRRTRALGPHSVDIAAPRETVFEVIAQPYLGRATRDAGEGGCAGTGQRPWCSPLTTPPSRAGG